MDELKKLETELHLQNKSERTIKNYLFFNQKFIDFAKKTPDTVTEEDIKKFIESSDKRSPATLSLTIASLRFFYDKVLGKNLFSNIVSPKQNKVAFPLLTKDEVKQLIANTDTEKSRIIISFLYSSGLKASELISLRASSINLEDRSGIISSSTGKRDRVFVISEKMIEPLKKLREKYPSYQYLFSKEKPLSMRNIQKIIKHTSLKAGFQKKITPHIIRKSFAAHLIELGAETGQVQAFLGEKSNSKQPLLTIEDLKKVKSPFELV